MAGIGDYIHYKSINYQKYGTNIENEGVNTFYLAAETAHAHLKNLIKRKKIKSDLNGLENYYTKVIYGGGLQEKIGDGMDDDDDTTLLETLTKYIDESVDNYAHTEDVERSLTQRTSSLLKRPSYKDDIKNITTYHVSAYLKALKQSREQALALAQQGGGSETEIRGRANDLIKQSESLSKALEDLNSQIEQSEVYRTIYGKKKNGKKPKIGDFKSIKTNDNIRDLLKQLNYFLSLYSGYYGSTLAGPGWEALITMGNIGFNNILKKEVDSLVGKQAWSEYLKKHGHRGTVKESIYINQLSSDYVKIGELASAMGGSWKFGPQSGQISGESTGTVDVIVKNESNEALSGIIKDGEELNASLKNISSMSKFGIHIIDTTNLFIILNLFDTDFINHYLNLLGSHPSRKGNFLNTEDFKQASFLIKYATAIRALSGARNNVANNLVADIIMINDRQSQKIYVRSIPNILDSTNEENIDDRFLIYGLPDGQGTKKWNNWEPFRSYNIHTREGNDGYALAKERITNFLLQVQKKKLSMSMSQNALK